MSQAFAFMAGANGMAGILAAVRGDAFWALLGAFMCCYGLLFMAANMKKVA